MSETVSQPMTATHPAGESLYARHYHLFRRLHSLTGFIPIGAFLIEHMLTNSAILLGGDHFQKDITFIWGLPALLMMEIFGIWLPIAFHGVLGVVYVFSGRPNDINYGYAANHRYTWMRITGGIAFVYIFLHLATTRWGWNIFGWHTPFEPTDAVASTARAIQFGWPCVMIFYVIGTLAVVFHFANGLWSGAITWGLTITVQAQRRWGYICCLIGILLTLMGLGSIWKFSTLPL